MFCFVFLIRPVTSCSFSLCPSSSVILIVRYYQLTLLLSCLIIAFVGFIRASIRFSSYFYVTRLYTLVAITCCLRSNGENKTYTIVSRAQVRQRWIPSRVRGPWWSRGSDLRLSWWSLEFPKTICKTIVV